MPQLSGIETDDGMRYFVMSVEPANATVYIDDQPQVVQNGTLSILLPMGEHRYKVESTAYEPKSGTFTIGNEKLSLPIKLQSNMATLNVGSTTQGTQIYVNDQLRGTSSWSGALPAGNYRIEGRLQGYRSHRQNLKLQQKEQRQLTIPALQAIVGNLNVNYQPMNAEVYLDGKLLGKTPNVFRNVVVGSHGVELRADGYISKQETVTIEDGKTAMLSGSLVRQQTAQSVKQQESVGHNTQDTIDFQRRQEILKYLEVFRSYYHEKNLKALRDIFSDNAHIITSNVVQSRSQGTEQEDSLKPKLVYTKRSKEKYISSLERTFRNNNSITVEFDQIKIERHPTKTDFYGVTFRRKWSSRNFSDSGYVFMLWEIVEGKPPVIHVHTWQPEMVGNRKLTEDEIFKMKDFPIQ